MHSELGMARGLCHTDLCELLMFASFVYVARVVRLSLASSMLFNVQHLASCPIVVTMV